MSDYEFAIFNKDGKIIGILHCGKNYHKKDTKTAILKEWKQFLIWRKESVGRKMLTGKEKVVADDNIPLAFREFLYMQNKDWDCGYKYEDVDALYM
jgi:hypothetical protein